VCRFFYYVDLSETTIIEIKRRGFYLKLGSERLSKKKKRGWKLAYLGKIHIFRCGRKMNVRLRLRLDDHSWVNQRSRLHMHQKQSSVTAKLINEREREREGRGEWDREKERERAVSRACFKSDSSVRDNHWLLLINNKCIPEWVQHQIKWYSCRVIRSLFPTLPSTRTYSYRGFSAANIHVEFRIAQTKRKIGTRMNSK